MADKARYPQIPSTVWWGVRAILQRSPTATVDERFLSVQLDVQEAAARAYLSELKAVGILTDEGKASPLAQRWRLDDTYLEAVTELVAANYPEGLTHIVPPGEADRNKVVSWFQKAGLGQGAAGNKAATYLLLSSPTPNEAPSRGPARGSKEDPAKRAAQPQRPSSNGRKRGARLAEAQQPGHSEQGSASHRRNPGAPEGIPLNVNVQIHISADAGSEQIESIFAAMRRYLYDSQST